MKKILLAALFIIPLLPLCGQEQNSSVADSAQSETRYPAYPRFSIGLGGGFAYSTIHLSDKSYDVYDHHGRYSALGMVYMQIPLGTQYLVLRPELSIQNRGDSMSYEDVHYGMEIQSLTARLGFLLRIPFGNHFAPYLLVSPYADFALGGKIHYLDAEISASKHVDISTANMKKYNYGLMLGGGFEFRLDFPGRPLYLSVEGAYNLGLTSTFSDNEQAGNTSQSGIANPFLGAMLWKGSRYNRGFEVSARLTIPLDGKFLMGYYKKIIDDGKKDIDDSPKVVLQVRDTVYHTVIVDTVYLVHTDTVHKETGISNGNTYRTKDCYSILDIHDFIDAGIDISNKRICMFNINFDFDSYTLPADAEDLMRDLLRLMWDYPEMTIEVYGHTDSYGTDEYNLKLSERRAGSVASYLFSHGIDSRRVRTYGLGERYPIASESTADGCFRNRRVEIEVLYIGRRYRRK